MAPGVFGLWASDLELRSLYDLVARQPMENAVGFVQSLPVPSATARAGAKADGKWRGVVRRQRWEI